MQGAGGLEKARVDEKKALVSATQENNKALVRRFLEAQGRGDLDVVKGLLPSTVRRVRWRRHS